MRTIITSEGIKVFVSDADYDYLNHWVWQLNPKGHVMRHASINGVRQVITLMAEVLARFGVSHPDAIDHKDRNKLNNQRENLRPATDSQNQMNRGIQSNNTSGYKGVSFDKCSERYESYLKFQGKKKSFGLFNTAVEAAKKYDQMAKSYFKEFAVLNFSEEI